MLDLKQFEVWFVTGSQHLYGEETLRQVDEHSQIISNYFDQSPKVPVRVVFKPVVKTPDEIFNIIQEANCAARLHWYRGLDAYFLSRQDVDPRTADPAKTIAAFAYTIQPGHSLGGH
jgi:hypothetical protein